MDIIILILLGYQLHRQAVAKGISSRPYLLNFIAIYLLINFIMVLAIMSIFGMNFIENPEAVNKVLMAAPFTILFEFLLYAWMRRRIQRLPDEPQDEEPYEEEPKDTPKKDLSYFR